MSRQGGLSDATAAPAAFAPRARWISQASPLAVAAAGDRGAAGDRRRLVGGDREGNGGNVRREPVRCGHDGGFELSARAGRDRLAYSLQAAAVGIDLRGWDADWTGARLFVAGLGDRHCASFGELC
jgi:hypothetical protein